MNENFWSREAWDACVSAKAFNSDWWMELSPEKAPELWAEHRSIFEEEQSIPEIPDWAVEIVVRMMRLPMCGYYAYPDNVNQIIDAIAAEQCPDVVMRCYTVDPDRKILLSYYVYCLDAWLKDAPLPVAVAELNQRDDLGKDWSRIAEGIFETLGEKNELKLIALERLIHRLRWWIKSLIWADDKRDRFLLDVYSGDIRGDEKKWSAYGNSPYGDPYFAELKLPRVKELEQRIRADIPNSEKLLVRIQSTWLCAPKVFRYLERLIAQIGAIGSEASTGQAPSILQCEDTYPDFDANREHLAGLLRDLEEWLKGQEDKLPSLGPASPVKHWLLNLLRHKLIFCSKYEKNFAKLVGARPHGKPGSKKPTG